MSYQGCQAPHRRQPLPKSSHLDISITTKVFPFTPVLLRLKYHINTICVHQITLRVILRTLHFTLFIAKNEVLPHSSRICVLQKATELEYYGSRLFSFLG